MEGGLGEGGWVGGVAASGELLQRGDEAGDGGSGGKGRGGDGVGEQCGSILQDGLSGRDVGEGGGEGARGGDDEGELGGGNRGLGGDGELGQGALLAAHMLDARGDVVGARERHREAGPEDDAAQDGVGGAHAHREQVARVEGAVQHARHLLPDHGHVHARRRPRNRLALALPLFPRLRGIGRRPLLPSSRQLGFARPPPPSLHSRALPRPSPSLLLLPRCCTRSLERESLHSLD